MRLALLATVILSGCVVNPADSDKVGNGRYLQVFRDDGKVIVEMDTYRTGMLSCSQDAHQEIQSNPSLRGKIKCVDESAARILPYSFIAQRQFTESDGFKRSSPYTTRTATTALCMKVQEATEKAEKTIILKSNCVNP